MGSAGRIAAVVATAALGWACSETPTQPPGRKEPTPDSQQPARPAEPATAPQPEPAAEPTGEELAARGKTVYMSNCIACHNMDPSQDGALGPAVTGSSHELLEARILRAEYPEGYTPKRDTNAMLALPHLEREIDALHAYLNR